MTVGDAEAPIAASGSSTSAVRKNHWYRQSTDYPTILDYSSIGIIIVTVRLVIADSALPSYCFEIFEIVLIGLFWNIVSSLLDWVPFDLEL